jgi:hypothetical protein
LLGGEIQWALNKIKRRSKMNEHCRHPNIWLKLTIPIAILLAIATAGGIFIHGLYRDNPYFTVQAVGQDFISLVVVLPTLIVTSMLARRGSVRAYLVWLGVLIYLVYTYVVATFDNNFNQLFLVYVALLGCSLYALIGGLATVNIPGIKACFGENSPARPVSVYLAVLAVLFYFLWLRDIVPALLIGAIPQSIQDNGTPTNAIQVLDMAWILPAFGIAAAMLWRKQALGYTLAGVLLSYAVQLLLAILSMVVFMQRGGFPVAVPQVVIFGTISAISMAMLIWYMRGLNSPTKLNL